MAKSKKLPDFIPDEEVSKFDSSPDFISDEDMEKMESKKGPSPLQTFGEQTAQSITLGYLPQLTGLAGKAAKTVGLIQDPYENIVMAKGAQEKKPSLDYTALRDETIASLEESAKQNPRAALAGSIGGALATAPIAGAALGGAKAATGLGRLGQAAKAGGIMGLIQNPGDIEGEIAPVQAAERLKGGAIGGLLGGAGQAAGEGIAAGARAIKGSGEALKKLGQEKAFKATGAMLKDFREAAGKNRIGELGDYLLEKKLVKPGANFESIAQGSAKLKEQAGKTIGDVYKKVGEATKVTIDKDKLYGGLIDAVSDPKVRPKVNVDAYDNAMTKIMDDVVGRLDITDVRNVNDAIGDIDDLINYSKRANELPAVQQGYTKIRNELRKIVNKHVDEVADSLGDSKLGEKLRSANKEYQNATQINKISSDRVLREEANRFLSPSDYGVAGIGSLSGSLLGGVQGAALGAGAGLLNKGARLYGNPLLAKGAVTAGGLLEKAPGLRPSMSLLESAAKAPSSLGAGLGLLGTPRENKKNAK